MSQLKPALLLPWLLLGCGDKDGGDPDPIDADADGYDQTSDCDDGDAAVNPGATEVCDDIDNDCDGLVDDADSDWDSGSGVSGWTDGDGDGWGSDAAAACAFGDGLVAEGGDCDDTDPTIHLGTPWYEDADGDGFGDPEASTTSCEAPAGHVQDDTDCDDTQAEVNPAATEQCDEGIDNDCDGLADDADPDVDLSSGATWNVDADGDGYGDPDLTGISCALGGGFTDDATDCDDGDSSVNPGATEICNDGVDNDCSGDAPGCELSGEVGLSTSGNMLVGATTYEYFGARMAMGDWDGDGSEALVAGAEDLNLSSPVLYAGAAYLFEGPLSGLMDPGDATATLAPTSTEARAHFGAVVANVGDLDGDGLDDLAAGAPGADDAGLSPGGAFIYYGTATGLSHSPGATFFGTEDSKLFGTDLAGLADFNGDGAADLAIGAEANDYYNGAVYLFFGPVSPGSARTADDADLSCLGPDAGYEVGLVATIAASDHDGDGLADLLVGSPGESPSYDDQGASYLLYGDPSSTGLIDLSTDYDATLHGEGESTHLHLGAWGGFDADGDGYEDFAIYEEDSGSWYFKGLVYILQGSATRRTGATRGSKVAWWTGKGDQQGGTFGVSMDAGDLNGDGHLDLVVSADHTDIGATHDAGAAFVYLGPLTAGSARASDADATIYGETDALALGATDTKLGDSNGDGLDDIFLSLPGYDDHRGAISLFYGGGF